MELHLTRDEWDRIAADGGGVLFRAGVAYMPAEMWSRPGPERIPTRPPAEFVEAAKPWCPVDTDGDGDCALCSRKPGIHGKRRVAVAVPCDGCGGEGGRNNNPTGWYWIDCHQCDTSGLVTVATVVVEWGPLVVVDGSTCVSPKPSHLCVGDGWPDWTDGRTVIRKVTSLHDNAAVITLPPDIDPQSLVGQYALGIRKVDR